MGASLAEQIARLPDDDRDKLLEDMDLDVLAYDPEFWLRPEQLEALRAEEWMIAMLAGRGAGKTRTGAEWVREKAKTPMTRIALVARTAADVRDTMIQGESGIMAIHPPSEMPEYTPSLRRLVWPNGSVAITYSAEEPAQLRGPQFHKTWADEVAAWKMKPDDSGLNAWDNVKIATRLGINPQIFLTTTPKRVPAVRQIVDMTKTDPHRVRRIKGSTLDNAANLSAAYIETITDMYKGTSIERQELDGELLDKVEGAIWDDELIINTWDLDKIVGHETITVVGVDPSVAEKPNDECGIIVARSTKDRKLLKRHAAVLEDLSLRASPETWAQEVVRAAKKYNAIIVAEKNQGHKLVEMAIKAVDPSIPVVMVWASKGKEIRAEPVLQAYEQGRVVHFGSHPELEDEMTSWVPGESGYSPNRLDALVWALSALLVDEKILNSTGKVRGTTPNLAKAQISGAVPNYRKGRLSPRR